MEPDMNGHPDEPSVQELLNDPIALLLMAPDGLEPDIVRACIADVRRKPAARERAAMPVFQTAELCR
jgi:hypothetical protein